MRNETKQLHAFAADAYRSESKLEHPLEGPVLPVGAVDQREHHIELALRAVGLDQGARSPGQLDLHSRLRRDRGKLCGARREGGRVVEEVPRSLAGDADVHGLVAIVVQRTLHGACRDNRYLVLRGAPPEDDGDPGHRRLLPGCRWQSR